MRERSKCADDKKPKHRLPIIKTYTASFQLFLLFFLCSSHITSSLPLSRLTLSMPRCSSPSRPTCMPKPYRMRPGSMSELRLSLLLCCFSLIAGSVGESARKLSREGRTSDTSERVQVRSAYELPINLATSSGFVCGRANARSLRIGDWYTQLMISATLLLLCGSAARRRPGSRAKRPNVHSVKKKQSA